MAAVVLWLWAVRWALRPRSESRSFGNLRGTILAALASAAALAVVTVATNAVAAWVLHERGRDLNMRAALLHMVGGMTASLTVVAAGVAILAGGPALDRADPVASLAVAAIVLVEAVRIAKESADALLESTPSDVDLAELRAAITATAGVVLVGHPTLELECEPCAVDDRHPEPRPDGGQVPGVGRPGPDATRPRVTVRPKPSSSSGPRPWRPAGTCSRGSVGQPRPGARPAGSREPTARFTSLLLERLRRPG